MDSHLELAKEYWKKIVKSGDTVIDATLGNGNDLVYLAGLLKGQGRLIGYEIQSAALKKTQEKIEFLQEEEQKIIELRLQSHEAFAEEKAALIVYNLGYLPGSDKKITTQTASTIKSLKCAINIASCISIMCYPGHTEGSREEKEVLKFVKSLSPSLWDVWSHRRVNQPKSPLLVFLKRRP